MTDRIPVWGWRDAIRKARVSPLTKLVCYSLANYMSDAGIGCWPKIGTLIGDSGMSEQIGRAHV